MIAIALGDAGVNSLFYEFVAENECTVEQRAACDSGNNRSKCAATSGGTSFSCKCPDGYGLDNETNCQGS